MPRNFNVPPFYRSDALSSLKRARQVSDPKKRDTSPSVVDFGPVKFKVARHFGFCFGVENAIEIAYRAVDENEKKQPKRRVFLLSEMIHNPLVNADLESRGVRFLMNTDGSQRIPFDELRADDVVIVPAFGTTVEIQAKLSARGIDPYYFDTTCPFVQKVWKRAAELGAAGYAVIVHGKRQHEETRATFSHSQTTAPTLVVLNQEDAEWVAEYMHGNKTRDEFFVRFHGAVSEGFDPDIHLKKIGVVNQTTMLATETQEIAEFFKKTMLKLYGEENLKAHFADTRDTLCYATYENQAATRALIDSGADLALVVGGYNSSNTSHLVELLEQHTPTYFIKDAEEIQGADRIRHFELNTKKIQETSSWLPAKGKNGPVEIAVTAGASCPDKLVDEVIERVAALFGAARAPREAYEDAALSVSS